MRLKSDCLDVFPWECSKHRFMDGPGNLYGKDLREYPGVFLREGCKGPVTEGIAEWKSFSGECIHGDHTMALRCKGMQRVFILSDCLIPTQYRKALSGREGA